DIKRVSSAGTVVQTYDASGEDDWEALTLDPNGASFWAGDASSHHFYRFNINTGAREVGPLTAGSSLGGICVDGGFSAAQPQPQPGTPALASVSPSPGTNTATFTSPNTGAKLTLSLVGLTNTVTLSSRWTL